MVSPDVSPEELLVIAAVLVTAGVGSGLAAWRRAPAVTLGLVVGPLGGVIAFLASSKDGPHGVPQDVTVWASVGVALFGLLGLIFFRGRAGAAPSWPAAVAVAVCAPLVATVVHVALTDACPLYVTRAAGYCHYSVDVMGGWATTVAVLVGLDMLGVALLLGVSSWQARRRLAA